MRRNHVSPTAANSADTDVVQNYLTRSLEISFLPGIMADAPLLWKHIVNLKCKCNTFFQPPIMLVLMRCKICTLMIESYLVLGEH